MVNLCTEKMQGSYSNVPNRLARARIHQLILVAEDARNFDILSVSEYCLSTIQRALSAPGKNGVLIHCWGGVNRSAAVLVAFLVTQQLRHGI